VEQLFLTGLVYYDSSTPPMDEQLGLVPEPLATLPESRIRPPASALAEYFERPLRHAPAPPSSRLMRPRW